MADLAARREARRKRILENAESRLQKITSVLNDKIAVHDHVPNPNAEKTPTIPNDAKEPNAADVLEESDLTSIFHNGNFSGRSSTSFTHVPNADKEDNVRVVVIIGLALMTTMLQTIVSRFESTNDARLVNKVFAPFLLYEFVDVFVGRRRFEPNPLTNVLVLFANVSPSVSAHVVVVLNTIARITQDLFIYFFIYIAVNLLIENVY